MLRRHVFPGGIQGMDEATLGDLRALSPRAASGTVRRILDGAVQDEAAFLFSAPAHWRVRHRSGEEIVVRDEDRWERSDGTTAWSHDRADSGTTPHHNGYLQAMLFPTLLPAINDSRSAIIRQETLGDGSLRLTISSHEPVDGVVVADMSPDGYLSRLEGEQDGVAVIELRIDSAGPPPRDLFDPVAEWEFSFGD